MDFLDIHVQSALLEIRQLFYPEQNKQIDFLDYLCHAIFLAPLAHAAPGFIQGMHFSQ